MTNNLMHYTLASNFDTSLLEFIKSNDLAHQVTSVYGKLPTDILGGGRTTFLSPKITLQTLRQHVDACSSAGLSFNYLLNPLCSGNHEFTPSGHKMLLELLYELCDMGVTQVTVTSPYLCELIKTQFPELKVTIGLFAYPNQLQMIDYWYNLGADEITLPHHFNRDFTALRLLLTQYKNTSLHFRLIANNSCLHYCPYALNHACNLAHSSQVDDEKTSIHIDYNLLKCKQTEIQNPATLIASEWIRPEDVHYYTALCEETGNFNLSLKLVERTKNTAFLTNVLKSYLEESYKGNLIDLLNWPSNANTAEPINQMTMKQRGGELGYVMPHVGQYTSCLTMPSLYLDNEKLDGFLEHFIHHRGCDTHVCGLNTTSSSPNTCTYCLQWAKKTISYNSEEVNTWLAQTQLAFDNMKHSKLFISHSQL